MKNIGIKISIKIIDSNSEKNEKKRMTIKEINKMSLIDLEKNINIFKENIDKKEIDEYSINTFVTLCGKAIEELNTSFKKEDLDKQKIYNQMIEDVYKLEKIEELNVNNNIKKINEENKNEIKEENNDNKNINEIKDN